jgi:hypothetical protein
MSFSGCGLGLIGSEEEVLVSAPQLSSLLALSLLVIGVFAWNPSDKSLLLAGSLLILFISLTLLVLWLLVSAIYPRGYCFHGCSVPVHARQWQQLLSIRAGGMCVWLAMNFYHFAKSRCD